MARSGLAIALAVVLAGVVGCGEPGKHELVLAESAKCMNDVADVMARVTNEQEAKVAQPGVRALLAQWRRLVREQRELGKKNPELYLYFQQQGAPLRRAEARYHAELGRLRRIDSLKAFTELLAGDMNPDKP